MASNKKYDFAVEQFGDTWLAKITRKVSSQKRVTTMEKDGFSSEAEATEWAQAGLVELTEKLKSSNEAQGVKRKDSEKMRTERSARRAEKTEQAKLEAAEAEKQKADDLAAAESLDSEDDYDFDEDEGSSQ